MAPVKILQLLAIWTALSVPVSVITGFALAHLEPQPLPVRSTAR